MQIFDQPLHWGHYFAGACHFLVATIVSLHAVLYKRDTRAVVLWVAFIWLSPVIGALAYYVLGVNRIRRRAALLRAGLERFTSDPGVGPCPPETLRESLPVAARHLTELATVVTQVVNRPLLRGNSVLSLVNGDEAFPRMLEAIANAKASIALATYIFDNDPTGREFAAALASARKRGIELRILIDDAGARYSWPSILSHLRQADIPVARFMPRFFLWRFAAMNLRSHRKIVVVDGKLGFTGGINIRQGHRLLSHPKYPVQDLHFAIEGPVVSQLMETFADDWAFCTGETLRGPAWFPAMEARGDTIARGVNDGPDEDFEKLRWTLLGAIGCARSAIGIVTPYFLPDPGLISALNLAVMRGVVVDIILPARSNLPIIDWASTAHWWQLLQWGCRIWLTPPPFDHSKFMTVDGYWALIGSANIDPRSLRLNFEFNVECYGQEPAATLDRQLAARRASARRVTLEDVDRRPLPLRIRDGVARLFTPFL